jgi:O-acetyl-ADP-ribose deacetylase (regulator of RNase III)
LKRELIFTERNICDVDFGIIGHGVNCQGVMGSGVANQLRYLYPEIFKSYLSFLEQMTTPGHALGHCDFHWIGGNLIIANCFTQVNYGRDSKQYASPEAIKSCLQRLLRRGEVLYLPVYIPMMGAGLGGLTKDQVQGIIHETFEKAGNHCSLTVCLHKE